MTTELPPSRANQAPVSAASSTEPFAFRSCDELVRAYRDGSTSPLEVIERALAAAALLDLLTPRMRTFLWIDNDAAREQAERSLARYRAGAPLGALDGVPVAIKDEIDVKGAPSTHGSAFLGKLPATSDSAVVEHLRRAGAVIIGKTNMHEFGAGPSGANPHHGAARNPYDPARDTGGSSSGSAAAVASGVVPLALGTDSGGSVRVPGALCGVASLKPTFGRVSTAGAQLRAWSLEHFGPIGARVDDVVRAMEALTGESFALPQLAGRDASRTLRIGICDAWWSEADAEVARTVRAAIDALAKRVGASVRAIELPHLSVAPVVMAATFGVEGAASLEDALAHRAHFGPSAKLAFELGRGLSAVAYVKTQRARALLARDFENALRDVDVIVTPTTAITAPRYSSAALGAGEIDEAMIDKLVHFTVPGNLTGLPAAQVPCGFDGDGMPVGLQVMAAHGHDALALAVAREVEAHAPTRRPHVWHDLLLPFAAHPGATAE